jgi:hypothetical protein
MKKQTINLSWPAQLFDFAKDTVQENFSRGRLKVFYKGETADHRFFSDAFSEELIKSLPYTPVVSYYDEEKEDFVGHATEQQILGIVDPCVEPSFEEDEDGKVWCVCDCVFYTERPDRVGDLAKKIVGHKQSLELDPNSVQYKINYDEKKHFKNIEFTAGRFVGVSVLGNDQKPAFTGSTFFACDENFENKMKILREYCEKQNDHENQGGNEMNLQEFMKLSWGEISDKVAQAVAKEYENDAYCYVVDMFEDAAICRFYYYMENGSKLMKIKYTCDENGNVCLGDIVEVRVAYEEVVEVSNTASTTEVEEVGVENATEIEKEDEEEKVEDETPEKDEEVEDEKEDDFETPSKDEEEEKEVTEKESTEEPSEDEEEKDDEVAHAACGDPEEEEKEKSTATDAADVSNAEVTETERVMSDEHEQIEETNTGSASFTQSERAEFEALKREKKVNLLNSYKEILSEEEFNKFLGSIDSFEEKDLEIELLKAYKASKDHEPKQQRAFAFAPILNKKNAERSSLDDFIKNNL